jgi:hypothetical protein
MPLPYATAVTCNDGFYELRNAALSLQILQASVISLSPHVAVF